MLVGSIRNVPLFPSVARVLPQQQRGDQEPRQHEEDLHPEPALQKPGSAVVEEHHHQGGDGANAVQRGKAFQRKEVVMGHAL
jgi:hypothetical protein